MSYLINPGGRIVEVEDPDMLAKFLKEPGFAIPSDELIAKHIQKRIEIIDHIKNADKYEELAKKGIYLATVSQGGKDGFGISSKVIIRELERLGVPVRTTYKGQKIGILYHNPYSIHGVEAPYKIIYTMFESDKIPDDWIPHLQAAHLVLVPSKWCQSVFKKAGIEAQVLPLGYDSEEYYFIERKNKSKTRETFNFLHYNAFNIRKGFPEVFKAFVKEFRHDEPVRLILKLNLDKPPLFISPAEYPNIEIITGSISEHKMRELMTRSDCFVFPSRGEGFGMTPLECMATGMPAIVPNAHGISEYFNPDYMYEAKVAGYCGALYSRYKGQDVGKMVLCDTDQLAAQMRYIYEHQEEALEMGKKASEYVKQWTLEKTARNLKKVIDEAMAKDIPAPKIINYLPLKRV